MAFFACFPLIHLAIGIAFICGAFEDGSGEAPPAFVGWILVAFAGFVVLFGWTLAVCMMVAGRKLSRQTGWLFCTVIAGIECLFMPVGTILGVFTIIVLTRDSVKELFAATAASHDPFGPS